MPSDDCLTAAAVVRRSAPHGLVEVELVDGPACRGCAGRCAWRLLPSGPASVCLASDRPLTAGTPVEVSLPRHYLLWTALVLHGWPLAGLLVGAVAGFAATATDLGALVGAAAGVAATVIVGRRLRRALEQATLKRCIVTPVR